MKNSLFSGISSAKKDDSSDSDDNKKPVAKAEPAPEINLLDMGAEDLLGGSSTAAPTTVPASSGNLLDDMFDSGTTQQPAANNSGGGLLDMGQAQPAPTQNVNDLLGGYGGPPVIPQ